MKKNVMSAALTLAAVLSGVSTVVAQEYPTPPKMEPGMSEWWTPQPEVITPGDAYAYGVISAPSDAVVLFDGKDLSAWQKSDGRPADWKVENGYFVVVPKTEGIETKQKFEDFQLHIEWSAPTNSGDKKSQGRGNSGIFMQGIYELQVLDCYQNQTYANGQAGSIYKQTAPLVNAMRKPGDWNVYDVIYTAPRFRENGTVLYPARITVLHNGVVIQNNTTILGDTPYVGFPKYKAHGPGPISLQDHGDEVKFRNVWIRPL